MPAKDPILSTVPPVAPVMEAHPGVREMLPNGYELLGRLGGGGMGVVYKARQVSLDRIVALKMIRDAVDPDGELLKRFQIEAEIVARLQHPNIVQIFEVGEHQGLPFFSQEYCEGGSLATWLRGKTLAPREAAAVLEQLARALHYAHQHRVLHRDLKPANILLSRTPVDEVGSTLPHAAEAKLQPATCKIADFGLAKKLDATAHTQTGAVMGTPSYMAPEQARADAAVMGATADVYALGAVLYEMLTGRPPFVGASALSTLEQVVNNEPVSPRALQPSVPRDLETICLKCLEKTPVRRYSTALELADELGRFQRGEPVRARPVGAVEKGWKWARRKPAQALLLAVSGLAAAALLVLGVGLSFYGRLEEAYAQSEQDRNKAETAETETRKQKEKVDSLLYNRSIERAHSAWREEDVIRAKQILADCAHNSRYWEWRRLHYLCHHEWLSFVGHSNGITSVVFSRDGSLLATASEDQTAKVWEAATGKLLHTFKHTAPVNQVSFNHDGTLLATAAWENAVRVWNLRDGSALAIHPTNIVDGKEVPGGAVTSVCFSPDGGRLVGACSGPSITVWDPKTGKELLALKGNDYACSMVAFSPDGKWIAGSSGGPERVRIWDAKSGKLERGFSGAEQSVRCVAFSRDGKYIAAACGEDFGVVPGEVKAWDVKTGDIVLSARHRGGAAETVAFNADGTKVASGGRDKVVRVWDVKSGLQVFTHTGHHVPVGSVAFSPDGSRLVSASGMIGPPGEIKLWDATGGPEFRMLAGKTVVGPEGLKFSADGRRLTAGINVFDVEGSRVVETLPAVHTVRSTAGTMSATTMGNVIVLADKGREIYKLDGHSLPTTCLAFTPDGKWLVSGAATAPRLQNKGPMSGEIKVWDTATGREAMALEGPVGPATSLAISPDGQWIACGDGLMGQSGGQVHLWEAATGKRRGTFPMASGVTSLAFSSGGLLAAGNGMFGRPDPQNQMKEIKVWDVATATERFSGRSRGIVFALAFTPDGTRLATGSGLLMNAAGEIALWDTVTGQEVFTLSGHTGHVTALAFSNDGRRLASAGYEGTVKIWEASLPSAGERR